MADSIIGKMFNGVDAGSKAWNFIQSIGKTALASLYPNDFELYMVALELTDSQDNVIDYLTFPVMPDSIQKSEPNRTNIKQTMSGITTIINPSFTPQEINIKGSFGRNFKILLNTTNPVKGVAFSTMAGKYDLFSVMNKKSSLSFSKFDVGVKTGYGVLKILKAIASKSVALDSFGKPMRLYFYNLALGESFLVAIPPSGVQFSQDLSKNMIWNYNLTMMTLAPIEAITNKKDRNNKMILLSTIENSVNGLATKISNRIL